MVPAVPAVPVVFPGTRRMGWGWGMGGMGGWEEEARVVVGLAGEGRRRGVAARVTTRFGMRLRASAANPAVGA